MVRDWVAPPPAPTLALSTSDDEFGTVPATHLRIEPEALGLESIGHFAFFNARFADSLWRIPLDWLRTGALTDDLPYRQIKLEPRR